MELKYQHFWTKKDGSKITDPWEIVYGHKHNYVKCRKTKVVREFVICGYNHKLSETCNTCIYYRRKEDERRKKEVQR